MATKMKLMKLLQEVRGRAQITNRRPSPRQPTLYLMQLRERSAQVQSPKRRLAVATDFKDSANTPLPIKINHVQTDESSISMVLR
jgi:hypothetical protein